jgi:hypothetical protein
LRYKKTGNKILKKISRKYARMWKIDEESGRGVAKEEGDAWIQPMQLL